MILNRAIRIRTAALTAALAVVSLGAAGCMETHHTIRTIDQHPSDDFSTLETSDERILDLSPIYERSEYRQNTFWNCQQVEQGLRCDRICDKDWEDNRICEPDLHGEFGEVSLPSAGVIASKYRAAGKQEASADTKVQRIEEAGQSQENDEEAGGGEVDEEAGQSQENDEEAGQSQENIEEAGGGEVDEEAGQSQENIEEVGGEEVDEEEER